MSYTNRSLKSAVPIYSTPVYIKQHGRKRLSDPEPDDMAHYTKRISELELELQNLNILDHSLRIIEICNQIRILRREISRDNNS